MMKRTSYFYWSLAATALLLSGGCFGRNAATRTPGKSSAQWIADGDKLLADAKLEDALAAFDSAVDTDPDSAQARQRRAVAYVRLGKPDRAVEDCDAALKLDGKLTDAHYTRGEAQKQLGATDKAVADFSRALDRSPDRADILAARAKLYQQMAAADNQQARKWLDLALKDFDKALKIQPRDAASLLCRAELLLDAGDYQPAIDDCDKALAIDQHLREARVARARALIGKGDIDKATADCTAAIEADGNRLDAYVVRGQACVEAWHEMRTLAAVAECSKVVDDCAKALSLSGQLKGDPDALRRGKQWLAMVHELCGRLYESLHAPAKALDQYSAALSMAPDLTDALVRRALNRGSSKDFAGALADCNQAIEVDRSRPEGYYGRGLIYSLQGQFAEAANDLDEAAARNYAKAYGGLASVYFNMANAELRKARNTKDQAELAAIGERINGYRQKCIDSATKELEASHGPHAGAPLSTRLLRGLAYADSRKFDAAYDDLNAVIHDDPLASKAYFYRGVVCFMASQKDSSPRAAQLLQASIKDFTRAIELQPNYASAYKSRGDDYHAIGNDLAASSDYATLAELRKQFQDEQNQSANRTDELLARPQQQFAAKLGPEFQPLIAAWKELEKKLDAALKK
jgi:tetratricopeptide (TPR) repeat protein